MNNFLINFEDSFIPESRREFLWRLKPLSEEGQALRCERLPKWITAEKKRITEAREKLIHYAAQQNQKMITFWLGRLKWAKKTFADLEAEKVGQLVPMVDNGIVLVMREDLEILRLWRLQPHAQ